MSDNIKNSIALGTFDGLHRGHMSVINRAIEYKEKGMKPIVLTFDSHPIATLKGEAPKKLLQTEERDRILSSIGAEVHILPFSKIKDMTPDEFFEDILIKHYNIGAAFCGKNYRFGKGGMGNSEYLDKLCRKFGVIAEISDYSEYNLKNVSSTRIRRCIEDGEIEEANEMLGRPFCYISRVMSGCKRGRLIGAPTINQYFEKDFILPKNGVYASLTEVDGKKYHSVTNIGLRPTFENEDLRSETHIIDFSGDLYGKKIKVELIKYIRDEVRFGDLEELKNQIKADIDFSQNVKITDGV